MARLERSRVWAYGVVAAASLLPRLAVLLFERGDITSANVDKGDVFARTFLETGTYGFIPGFSSAYTQPLYGFFLVPVYWIAGRSWVSVGIAQLAVAALFALLVYELGRRTISPQVGLGAALIATLHPYLVWHDVHMNREVLDEALAAALVLVTLIAVERRSTAYAAIAGVVAGVAVLGNVRLALLPLVLAAWVLWRLGRTRVALLHAAVLVVVPVIVAAPWVVRNAASVGCVAITTDARALWKANNEHTLETLRNGRWIDDVPPIPGAPPTPQDAGEVYERTGRIIRTDECAQMRFYRARAAEFVREDPGEKLELAGLAATMLWQPRVTKTEGRPGADTWLDTARDWIAPAYMLVLYALALAGARFVPRPFLVLAVALLVYQTLAAMAFVGATRYRVPWDFLLAIPAAAAAVALVERRSRRRA